MNSWIGWGIGVWLDGWMMDGGYRWMNVVVRWMDQNDCRLVCRALFYRRKNTRSVLLRLTSQGEWKDGEQDVEFIGLLGLCQTNPNPLS